VAFKPSGILKEIRNMKKILALMVLGAFSMVTFAAATSTDDTKKEEGKKKKKKKKEEPKQ
jgi:ribosomal protein L12E/L44/L45/RPP1/RPP2